MTKIAYTIDGKSNTIQDESSLTAWRKFAEVLDAEGIPIADSNMRADMIGDQISAAGQERRIAFEVVED